MKKIILFFLTGLFIVSISGFVGTIFIFATDQTNESNLEPHYVFTKNFLIKGFIESRHDFGNVFSADLSKGQLKAIQMLGIKTEPVSIFTIIDTCRNDKDCSLGYYCDKSQAVRGMGTCELIDNGSDPEPEPEPTRKCYPSEQLPWGVVKVNGGSGGQEIKVAVLDTGVTQSHLDLESRIIECKSTVTRFVPDAKSCQDSHGHGTHVAGTILADGGKDNQGIYGVAPEAELISIKVCDRQGRCYGDDIAAGINQAVNSQANIISMSLGGSSLSSLEQSAIDEAVTKGVLIIAAAGNSGPNLNTINYPAAYHKVVSVAAIDSSEFVPNFSSRGIDAESFEEQDRYMEVAAPGVNINSTWNDGCYRTLSGTSMATPHVSGLAAKLWQGDAQETRELLRRLAQYITKGLHTSSEYDPASGFGLPVAQQF